MSDGETFSVEVWIVPLVEVRSQPLNDTGKAYHYRGEIPTANWYDPDCDVQALALDMAYHDLQETVGWRFGGLGVPCR